MEYKQMASDKKLQAFNYSDLFVHIHPIWLMMMNGKWIDPTLIDEVSLQKPS